MALKSWKWDKFYGGIAQDDFLAQPDQFSDCANLDIVSSPKFAKPYSAATDNVTVFDADFTLFKEDSSGSICTATTNGKVYIGNSLKTTIAATPKSVFAVGELVVSSTRYKYWFRNAAIDRSAMDGSSYTEGHKTYTNGKYVAGVNSQASSMLDRPIYDDSGIALYWGSGQLVYKMDTAETVSLVLTFPQGENVTHIGKFQDLFRIYVKNTDAGYGVLYLWDGTSGAPNYRILLSGLPVLGVLPVGSVDYAVIGFSRQYSDLYVFSGTQYKPVFSDADAAGKLGLNGAGCVRNGVPFFVGYDGVSANTIIQYGANLAGFPNALSKVYVSTGEIIGLYGSSARLNFPEVAGGFQKTRYLDMNASATRTASASITSSVFYGDSPYSKKKLVGMRVGHYGAGTLTIQARKIDSGAYTTVMAITTPSGYAGTYITANQLAALGFGTFNVLQLKVSFTSANALASIETIYEQPIGQE